MIYTAYELQAHFKAGLVLAGQNEEGELQWLGEPSQYEDVLRRIALKETHERWYER